jgi:NitT/TauT family transport system substrate-binding protein
VAIAETNALHSVMPVRPTMGRGNGGIQALDRAFLILDIIADAGGEAKLTEIAGIAGLNVSTCHHLISTLEADRLIAEEPEKYSELITKVTGIEAEVAYLFHGPLGLQTRSVAWKPEYRQAVATSIKTLRHLKRADSDLDINQFVTDKFIRLALSQVGRDYDVELKNYAQLPLKAKDATTGADITDFSGVAQIWVKDEPQLRHFSSLENALRALAALEKQGKAIRVVYVQDRESGIKLFANQAWFVRSDNGELSAFLLKDGAEKWSNEHGGDVIDYAGARESLVASR